MSINDTNNKKTVGEVLKWASSFLKMNRREPYIAEWVMKELFSWTITDLLSRRQTHLTEEQWTAYKQAIEECADGRPPQQVVGHEWFYGRPFTVTPDTLIPRPETEEWFHRYLKMLPEKALKVLDIGTGSGVLAVSHKLERSQDKVTAVDMSPDALAVARKNAWNMGADVNFMESDVTEKVTGSFDLVLSNPPYISQNERSEMDESVLNFEPQLALFADDECLYFYKKMAEALPRLMNKDGHIILEYGYRQGEQVKAIFEQAFPEADVVIWKDMSGHDRALHISHIDQERQ